jgi:hypothetical protein
MMHESQQEECHQPGAELDLYLPDLFCSGHFNPLANRLLEKFDRK